jgi:hypothetical protein
VALRDRPRRPRGTGVALELRPGRAGPLDDAKPPPSARSCVSIRAHASCSSVRQPRLLSASYGGGSVKALGWSRSRGGRGGTGVCGLACRGGAGCGVARRLVSLICEPVEGASGPWFVAASAVCNRASPSAGTGGWLTGESADVRVCAMPGPPRRLDAPDCDVAPESGGGDLPTGADQLTSDRDRDHAGRLAAAFAQQLPARV